MKKKFLVFAAVALFLAPTAFGDIVSGPGGFQSWGVGDLNQNGTPYWDALSWDGARRTSGTACPVQVPAACRALPAISRTTGLRGAPRLVLLPSSRIVPAARQQCKSKSPATRVPTSSVGTKSAPISSTELFTGPQGAGAVSTFTPTANYGFYLQTGSGHVLYQLGGLGADSGKQHFALFQQSAVVGSEVYWMGIEDLPFLSSDKDYNDMVIKLNSVAVPEPSSILGLGLGLGTVLFLLGTSLRRKRAQQ